MRLLTLDIASSGVRACVWDETGLVGQGRSGIPTQHPQPGWSEQDTGDWWRAVVSAASQVPLTDVQGVCLTGQRETVVPVSAEGRQLRPAMLWSDRRGTDASVSAAAGRRIGATAALVRWLGQYDPDVLDRADWLAGPRDWLISRLTGARVTDRTMASRTGLYDPTTWSPDPAVCIAAGADPRLLPTVLPSDSVVGQVTHTVGVELGLRPGTPVVLGAGDRACEVLGVGATESEPMVSWGTTVNVSVPRATPPATMFGAVSAAIGGGWLQECGLSAGGSALVWLALGSGISADQLATAALASDPGARGVVCLPWLNGARAPWWEPAAHATWFNIGTGNTPGDLARALYEGVAHDVRRCLLEVAPESTALRTAGAGADEPAWIDSLAGVSGRRLLGRTSAAAASVGAALLGSRALGAPYDLDRISPVTSRTEPQASAVAVHQRLTARHDAAAAMTVAWAAEHPLDRL